jgi:predicted dehydrogenase/nucleoside-diphosphate-sugar epimerase
MPSAKKIRAGLVGAGYVSAYHIRALKALDYVEIVGIADLDRERAQTIAQKCGVPAVFSTLEEMSDREPDVIHVLTPPASHCAIAVKALKMGYHVLVEKPMAESVEECDRMIAAAREAGRMLSVNHSARMDPIIQAAAEKIARGACGRVLAVDFLRSSDYPPFSGGPELPVPYRTGSYPLQDLGVHGLTLFEAFLGPVQSADIRFSGTGLNAGLSFDEWHGVVQCERGVGRLYLSWNVRPMQNEVVIYGNHGVMHVDCVLQTCTLRKVWPAPKFVQRLISAMTGSLSVLWRVPVNVARFATGRLLPSPGIHAGVIAFYKALRDARPAPVSAEEGRRVVACMESASRRADQEKIAQRRHTLEQRFPPARVLVTGGSGFLGRALVRRLVQRGESVRVLVRNRCPEPALDGRVQVVYGDLGDPAIVERAVQGVEVVFHVGAAMRGGAADFERGTIWGTKNIIAAVQQCAAKRLVYVSSLSVLDHARRGGNDVVDQNWPLEPQPDKRGYYTQSKLVAEQLVVNAIHDHSLPAVIVRPGQIFGPGAEQLTPSGVISLAGRWMVVGNGRLRLPLVYVEDVVDALLLAAEQDSAVGHIFHIVDESKITQREYIEHFAATNSKQPVHYVPQLALYLAGCFCDAASRITGKKLPLSRYRIRSIKPLSRIDVSPARQLLSWAPKVGVRKGLEWTFGSRVATAARTVVASGSDV